jgi:Fe-S oxidoreductase
MSVDKSADQIIRFAADNCESCGLCTQMCSLLGDLGSTPAEIAASLLRGEVEERMLVAIQRCDLCGGCGQDCPAGVLPGELFLAARQALVAAGRISSDDYDVMRVDRDWNFFTIYRDTYGIRYDDLRTARCETLFFPGCTLAAYSPKLTRAAYAWLQGQGRSLGFSDLCCGKPLASIGLRAEEERLLARLRAEVAACGAREIVTACPNCEAHLRNAAIPGVTVRSLYGWMFAAGVRLEGSQTLTFHDSCPDRCDGRNPRDVRGLLSGFPQVEMPSRGGNTLCCGSGGIVSAVDPDLCAGRAARRLAELSVSGADACVTSCMACAHRLARAGSPGQVRHCLEYVFGIPADYAQVERNTQQMWEGPQGEVNRERLANARPIQVEESW